MNTDSFHLDSSGGMSESLASVGWARLTDEDRDAAFNTLPNMLEGFMKLWGWLDFAKAIEQRVHEKNRHLLDASKSAQDDAYVEGRKDQQDEDAELLRWAYSKLHHVSFTKQDDALMQDRLKLLLEHRIYA